METHLEDVCGEHSSSEFQKGRPSWKMAHFEEDTHVSLLVYIFSAKPAHDDPQRREKSLDGGQDAP